MSDAAVTPQKFGATDLVRTGSVSIGQAMGKSFGRWFAPGCRRWKQAATGSNKP